MSNFVISAMKSVNLDTMMCRSQPYDGTRNVLGKLPQSSAQKQEIQKLHIFTGCPTSLICVYENL